MHEAAGAPPQLTDGACEAAQSTGAAALRPILQARPLALRLHRERAIVAKNTDLCAADLHGGRAQRRDNRRPRMLARMRTHRASCSPGGGRPSSPPERPCPGSGIKTGVFFRPSILVFTCFHGNSAYCGHAITPCDSLSALLTVLCCTIDRLHSSRP